MQTRRVMSPSSPQDRHPVRSLISFFFFFFCARLNTETQGYFSNLVSDPTSETAREVGLHCLAFDPINHLTIESHTIQITYARLRGDLGKWKRKFNGGPSPCGGVYTPGIRTPFEPNLAGPPSVRTG